MAFFNQQNIHTMDDLREKVSETINEVYGLEIGQAYFILEETNETISFGQKIIVKKRYSFSKGILLSVGVGGISDYEEAYIGPAACVGMLNADGETIAKNISPEAIFKDRDTIVSVIQQKNEEAEKAFLKKIVDSVLTTVSGLTVHFGVGNAAYRGEDQNLDPEAVAKTLHEVATLIQNGHLNGNILDVNGNVVGLYNIIDK